MSRGPDPDVPAWKILEWMINHPDKGFTAREVGDEFGKTRQWADTQLDKLVERDLAKSKNPGGRSKFYWTTDQGEEHYWENSPD